MPRPKTGTIVIRQEGGKHVAYIRNQGGQEFLAEGLGDLLRDFQGKTCTFTAKGGKVQQVSVGGTTHDAQPDRPEAPAKEKFISKEEALQQSREAQHEFASESLPEPELSDAEPCAKRKPMEGTNLFAGNPKSLRLPTDTAHHIQQLFNRQEGSKAKLQLDNFALLLNKSVHFGEIGRQNKPEFLDEHLSDGKAKPFIFRQSFDDRSGNQKVKYKFEIEFDFPPELIAHTNRRQQAVRDAWKSAGWQVSSTTFTPDFRLIMGLGTASVFETSLTLHHIYGIPYLPASSTKGVTRSWVIVNYFDQKEEQALKDPLFAFIFGTNSVDSADKTARRGHVMFFDAFPQSPPVIEPDIMNVHYPDWYSTGKTLTDTQSPNPIPFLTVGKCDANQKPLQVRFDLAVRENLICENILKQVARGSELFTKLGIEPATHILVLTQQLLSSALTSHGIGAKTAVGYGFFQPSHS